MFYQYSDELTTIEPQDRDPNLVCAAYITLAELDAHYEKFGFSPSTVQQCKEENRYFRSNIEVYDDYSFGTLKITDAANARAREDCPAFYVKKNFLLLVDINDADCSTRNKFISALHRFSCANITLEKLIYAFLESLVSGDNKALEDTEFEINRMEEYVLQDKAGSDFNMELLHKKKELSVLRNYYEQLIDIGEALEENENEIFEREDLRYFKIFTDKAVRLRENVDLLRDSIVHLRDAYQAYLDLKLNETMKLFTVLTAVFLPLTVIVGWYGMNFRNMPELTWKYGYFSVIVLSALVVGVLVAVFKRKKWM